MSEEIVFDKVKIDDLIKQAEQSTGPIKIEKSDDGLRQELFYLMKKVFGEEVVYTPNSGNAFYKLTAKDSGTIEPDLLNPDNIYFTTRNEYLAKPYFLSFGKLTICEEKTCHQGEEESQIAKIRSERSDGYGKFYRDATSSPLTVTAYTQQGFDKAKIFAHVYNAMSGQPVRVVRACADNDSIDKLVSQVQANPDKPFKKRHNPEITPKDIEAFNKPAEVPK